jgi:hypothetical protein
LIIDSNAKVRVPGIATGVESCPCATAGIAIAAAAKVTRAMRVIFPSDEWSS